LCAHYPSWEQKGINWKSKPQGLNTNLLNLILTFSGPSFPHFKKQAKETMSSYYALLFPGPADFDPQTASPASGFRQGHILHTD